MIDKFVFVTGFLAFSVAINMMPSILCVLQFLAVFFFHPPLLSP